MPETLLRTKLFVPPLRPNLVPRPKLIKRLKLGLELGQKLTLVSAPAGFGKTTVVSEWLAGCARPAAWFSLDEEDNNPTRFLVYHIRCAYCVHRAPIFRDLFTKLDGWAKGTIEITV